MHTTLTSGMAGINLPQDYAGSVKLGRRCIMCRVSIRKPLVRISWVLAVFFANAPGIVVPRNVHAGPSLACLKRDTLSFPVQIESGVESRVDVRKLHRRAVTGLSKIRAEQARIRSQLKILSRKLKRTTGNKLLQLARQIDRLVLRMEKLQSQGTELQAVFELLSRCRRGAVSQLFPQIVEAQSFSLPTGQQMHFRTDLTIRSDQTLNIAGQLLAEEESAASITLLSRFADVVLAPGALVRAGDGTSGVFSRRITAGTQPLRNVDLNQGKGRRGGSIVLSAVNGRVVLQDEAAIQIGNGGNGADLILADTARLPEGTVKFGNGGGASGNLLANAREMAGFDGELLTLDGRSVFRLRSTKGIGGGEAGLPGRVEIGSTLALNSTPKSVMQRLGLDWHPAPVAKAADEFSVEVKGAEGETGFRRGGPGQSLSVRGKDGETFGEAGQTVMVTGGRGGSCSAATEVAEVFTLLLVDLCIPGRGGDAKAVGGNGAPGAPGENGGDGGGAVASGGAEGLGLTPESGNPAKGFCGDSTAIGGTGGDGGTTCKDGSGEGGDGGDGGSALAQGFSTFAAPGKAEARPGRGGDGGDGGSLTQIGAGGFGAFGNSIEGAVVISSTGAHGLDGGFCPTVPRPSPTPSPTIPPATAQMKTAFFAIDCPTDADVTLTFFVDVNLPADAFDMSHTVFDQATGINIIGPFAEGSFCEEQSFTQSVEVLPPPFGDPEGKKAYRVTISLRGSSSGQRRDLGVKVSFLVPIK